MPRTHLFRSPNNAAAMLGIFLAIVIIVGSLAGIFAPPGVWFAQLNKPFFLPPIRAFTPFWLAIYILTSIVGWRIWLKPNRGILLFVWGIQLVMFWLWLPVFHALKLPSMALSILATAGAMLVLQIIFLHKKDRISVLLLLVQLAWVGAVSILNGAILLMN